MKDFLGITFFDNTVGEYVFAVAMFCILIIVFYAGKTIFVRHMARLAAKTASDIDDFVIGLIDQIRWPVITIVSFYISASSLTLPGAVKSLLHYLLVFIVTIRVILLLQEIIHYGVSKSLLKRMDVDNPSFKSMVSLVTSLVKGAMWGLGIVFILSNLGINVSSLMAGIGIGGIAVAMASQALLGDAFSALSIYLDKPFEVGDFIIVDNSMGTVEHIGIKTTRIRSLSGEQLVFANSDLTKSRIRNYKRMQTRRAVFKIGVTYQTSIAHVEQIPEIIKDILKEQEVRIERVHFLSFDDSALTYEIAYHVSSSDYNVYMDKQQAINIAIMRKFKEKGIEFAYPTQTLYVKNESMGVVSKA